MIWLSLIILIDKLNWLGLGFVYMIMKKKIYWDLRQVTNKTQTGNLYIFIYRSIFNIIRNINIINDY